MAKVLKVAHIPFTHTLFLPQGGDIELIFTLWAVRVCEMIFKIAIFGHETWPLAKVLGLCSVFLPHGVELELIFTLLAAVSQIQADFQNFHVFGHKTWNLKKSPRNCICTFFSIPRVQIELIFTLQALHGFPVRAILNFN